MIEMPLSGKQAKARVLLFGGRNDYLMEAEKLSDQKGNQEVINSKSILSKLAEMSNKMFSSLKKTGYITKNNLNIFPMNIEKPQALVNFILFLKLAKPYIMSQVDHLFRIAAHLQKNALNF